ncbi:MAG: WecB/TagA/CpsF family glycosyltransferase [Candidatus Bathyarchaeia archaeon]|uniref:N-acetylglucosaminyldiphosphoundecaprenol N-acetyl-beta-D-mannosaminyltransferase n=1 Tax=Kryptobacter tengchongensis TaxID=1643429 RepID=A0A916LII0_KRYT1|nr:WecB/TagA/CpsF family glycosyltransferase [Candidatus Kryptobacter tengchongensis]CUS97495.1 N-acetylglucosaminyldiphosphoundecaprenol N-acetyl-beta-D-mannosaminyltransferase [Candidatus Kryptobacter tengchongensis]
MVFICGIHIFDKSLKDAVNLVVEECLNSNLKTPKLISARDAHGIVISKKDKNFHKILSSFDINLPDGVPIVWIGRLKGSKEMGRCSGVDFFQEIMITTKDKNIKHFLCGGKEGVPEKLKMVCEKKFGNKNIVGTYSPPFRDMSEEEIKILSNQINSLGADIVWVGLSTPKQEVFAYRLSKYLKVKFICTVGAAFDFHTGRVKRAPKFMQNIGLEWLYRLIKEPKRLFKRYAVVVPMFIYYAAVDLIKDYFRFYSCNRGW